ncbi:helix-turn-helix domain-containing protein [Clostridiaceae bacterium HFYG-1003]|nr:helix-turn-helix domain-containing protein [Clostridiaceae bacterium HFYG-1003]
MNLVLINVSSNLSEQIIKQFPQCNVKFITSPEQIPDLMSWWLSEPAVTVLYENNGDYRAILERIRECQLPAQYLAALTRKSISEIQNLINEGQVNQLFQMADQKDDLLRTLDELIRKETHEKREMPPPEDPTETSIEETMVTSFFIYDLIYGDLDKANRMKTLRKKFGLMAYPNCAMTIMVDNFWELCQDLDNKSRYGIKMVYLDLLKDFIETAAVDCIACSLIGTDKLIALVNVPGRDPEQARGMVVQLAQDLKKFINRKAGNTVSIGVGSVYPDWQLIWKSYEEAFRALEYSFYVGSDSVIQFEETRNFTTLEHDEETLPSFKYNFFKNINNWSESEIIAYYETTLEHLVSKSFSSETIKSIVIKYNFEILDYLEQMELAERDLNDYVIKVSSQILRASTMENIKATSNEFISIVAAAIVSRRSGNAVSSAIDSARAFIVKYYYRDLSLEVMSQVSNLSTAYFSRKFKEQTGQNFSEFLERARLERATELLLTSDLSLNEIADQVGFNDYSYFSSRFKKNYGIGPLIYKQQKKGDDRKGV